VAHGEDSPTAPAVNVGMPSSGEVRFAETCLPRVARAAAAGGTAFSVMAGAAGRRDREAVL